MQRSIIFRSFRKKRSANPTEETIKHSPLYDELQKLDTTLSNDVLLLRNQIEIANFEFMEVQKRFDKCEKEYLEAKLELFHKQEKKELLTFHLCSIIEKNELQKAKKLSELVKKWEMISKPIHLTQIDEKFEVCKQT